MTDSKIQVHLRGLHFVSLYAGKRNEFLLSVSAANLDTMYEFDVQNARKKTGKKTELCNLSIGVLTGCAVCPSKTAKI
jgi:hypothetical protein